MVCVNLDCPTELLEKEALENAMRAEIEAKVGTNLTKAHARYKYSTALCRYLRSYYCKRARTNSLNKRVMNARHLSYCRSGKKLNRQCVNASKWRYFLLSIHPFYQRLVCTQFAYEYVRKSSGPRVDRARDGHQGNDISCSIRSCWFEIDFPWR